MKIEKDKLLRKVAYNSVLVKFVRVVGLRKLMRNIYYKFTRICEYSIM